MDCVQQREIIYWPNNERQILCADCAPGGYLRWTAETRLSTVSMLSIRDSTQTDSIRANHWTSIELRLGSEVVFKGMVGVVGHRPYWHPMWVMSLKSVMARAIKILLSCLCVEQKAVFMANKLCDCILVVADNEDSKQWVLMSSYDWIWTMFVSVLVCCAHSLKTGARLESVTASFVQQLDINTFIAFFYVTLIRKNKAILCLRFGFHYLKRHWIGFWPTFGWMFANQTEILTNVMPLSIEGNR